jgi:hypothetical protein
MGLKALKLPLSVITDLYSKGLIAGGNGDLIIKTAPEAIATPADEKMEEAIAKPAKPKYLGKNNRNILILVDNPDMGFLEETDLGFLTNMLTACKLSLQDVAIVNIAGIDDFSYKKTIADLSSTIVMLLGPTPSALGLPLDFPYFQVQPFSGLTFLSTPVLAEIKNDQLQKSKLWVCLRRIFNV